MPAERVKLVGLKARVGRVNDDMRLADLVLKLPTQKVIVMGTPDEELLREPSSPVEIFDDLSDRPIQITKYTAWEWARCSRGELDGFNEDSGKPWKCVFVDTFLIDGPPDPSKWASKRTATVGPRPAPPGAAALHGQGERSCEGWCVVHRSETGRTDAGPAV